MLYFTEVLSHYGKNPAPTKEVIPWEKQPHFSTAGYAPIPAFIADRHLWRVPNQPAEPSPVQPLLSVSYTHLDVYKRQDYGGRPGQL